LIVIPAIDLKEGRCVRLSQGRMDQESVYSDHPVEMAIHWESKGAERIHVVDLNGAVTGTPYHKNLIKEMVHAVRVPIEVGGGIRDLATVEDYLASGVKWVIFGTSAFKNPTFVQEVCKKFPGRIILGVDAKGGKVSVQGWKEDASVEAIDLVKQFEGMGISSVIFTDIERDGMSTGVNREMTRTLARSTSIPVIASGGVSRIEDIASLLKLEADGIIGVIVGRALYTGRIDLAEAVRLTKKTVVSS
jgi:phosphoribosylformimino-5-aminoimidazole carboxamide ribotide isomerase